WIMAAGHLSVAVLAFVGARVRRIAWRVTAILSLLFFVYVLYASLSSALYVATLYSGVGMPVAAGLGAALVLVGIFLVPMGVWGLARTGGLRGSRRAPLALSALAVLLAFGLATRANAARGEARLPEADDRA